MLDHVPTICRFCVPEKHLQKQLIEHAVFAALAAAAACFQTEMVIASRFTERKGPNCYVPPSSNDILVFSFCVYIRRSWQKKKTLHWTNTSACMSCSMCVSSLHILTNYDWSLTASSSSAPNQKRIKY